MSMSLAPVEVGAKIMEWYSCIVSRDLEQAKKLKGEVKSMLERMQADDKMVSYFLLVNLRYDMLVESLQKLEIDAPNLDHLELSTDHYLRFMYYFISGQSEFYHGRYKSAIRSFKIAERLIEEVNDPAEKAEFYQKLGISYYRIDQYTFAASYMEMALEFFEKDKAYIELEINSKLILAAIDTELERFEEAERTYKDLLRLSKPFPAALALVYRNMGLNRITQDKLEEAQIYLEAALSIKEHRESILGVKTKFNFVNIELRTDSYSSGLDEIEREVNHYELTEYIAKCKINRGLYLNNDVSLVEKGINELLQGELYFDCSEVAKEISSFYEREEKLSLALKYLNLAYRMQKKQSQLGVDQK